MLTEKQVNEIREHLERAQNPIFFFDNDPDGLCSFLLLQRYLGRGKGVAIKSFPGLSINYFRKIEELKSDYVFILDKPLVDDEFFKEVGKINVPVVWIDHHDVPIRDLPEFVKYYNPFFNSKSSNEPVTALCYQITKRKEDLWMAVIGCISDTFYPEFYPEFCEIYPELASNSKSPLEIRYSSKLGDIISIVSNGLKDTTSNVVAMLKFLIKTKSPYDVLEDTSQNHRIHYRSNQINKKYKSLLDKAKSLGQGPKKLLFFKYSGDLSVSGEMSNELCYNFPDKIIVVAYVKGAKANLSLRGKNIRDILLKAIKDIEGATGGGHKDAVGGQMSVDNLTIFKKKLEEVM